MITEPNNGWASRFELCPSDERNTNPTLCDGHHIGCMARSVSLLSYTSDGRSENRRLT
jgi:hypothetical protein